MTSSTLNTLDTQVCIAGGGPAGMMLGYLLARSGIEVVVLEKWPDFFRDFRGDTIHPSTMENLAELGLLESFLKLPHQKVVRLSGQVGQDMLYLVDFSGLRVHAPFIAFVPQWDFLNFMADNAKRFRQFTLLMNTEATTLIEEGGRIVGLNATSPNGPMRINAKLVVGADGRRSVLREQAGLRVETLGAPMDVLWFRIPRKASDPDQVLGRIVGGHIMIMISRTEYWQCGYVIRKGALAAVQQRGLDSFRRELRELAPFLGERVETLTDWDEVKLLTVAVDRLHTWHRPGLLCIGDAAHAMSPIGGVGINLAIQDAVAAANYLVPAFRKGADIDSSVLESIQRRRMFMTRVLQKFQTIVQNRFIDRILGSKKSPRLPLLFRLFNRFTWMRRIPARFLGLGLRPEHVSAEIRNATTNHAGV
jgi:2-polyprenyl-6-methoxyphenol hydroxylase-like FAD-dependent oxidoreductase